MKATEMIKQVKNLLGVELSDIQLAELKLENGTVLEADAFESGKEVFIKTEDENVALPVGEYELEDGRSLVVKVEGLIDKIKGFEKGGRPPKNKPSIVGEKGAELFVPDTAGTIVPNNQLVGGKPVTVNFNINPVDARGFNELLVNSRGVIVNMINSAVNEKGKVAII